MRDAHVVEGALSADLDAVDDLAALAPTTPRHLLTRLGVMNASRESQQAALDAWFAAPDADYPPNLVGMMERRGYHVHTPAA